MPLASLSVAVADDSPAFRRMLVRSLGLLGHVAFEVSTLAQLEDLIAAGRPDVVLLDWGLTGDVGLAVVDHLAFLEIAVVIVTGDPDTVEATGLPVLAKPFALDSLRSILEASRSAV